MKIALVIPTFNRITCLKQMIQSVENQEKLGEVSLSIIVVNDGSTDGTSEYLSKKKDIYVVEGNGDWWYTKSLNEGMKYAVSTGVDFVLTLNDDLILPKNYVFSLSQAVMVVGNNCIIGSISLTADVPNRIFFSGIKKVNFNTFSTESYLPFMSKVELSQLKGIFPSYSLPGRGIIIPVSILIDLNYFDEKFIQYGSDTDFCYRARKNGYKVFVSYDAQIFSYWKETGKGSPFIKQSVISYTKNVFFNKYSARYFGNNIRMLQKHYNLWLFPFLLTKVFLAKFKAYYKNRKFYE